MASRSAQLAVRRDALLARSEYLRTEIAATGGQFTGRLSFLDGASAFLRSGGGRLLLGGAAVFLWLGGGGRVLKVASRVAIAWPILRPWLPRVSALTGSNPERKS